MFPKKMVKVICLVLAALMILSGVAVLIQVFAADAAAKNILSTCSCV